MEPTREAITTNLAERWCWPVVHRDDARVARRLDRQPVVDGVYRLDEGAVLDDCFHVRQAWGVVDLWERVRGQAIQRDMGPLVPSLLRSGLKTLFGVERMKALPALRFSDEALMRLVGFKATQVREGVCRRSHEKRQGAKAPGPICPDTLAKKIVQLNVRDLEAVFNGVIRALAQAGVVRATVTGRVDGTELETTAPYDGGGRVTRQRKITDKHGTGRELEVTVYGGKLIVVIDARTKIPLAVRVGPMHAHAVCSMRALVTQAQTNLAGAARRHNVVCDRGFLGGVELWGLDQHGITCVVPAQENMAVTVDAQAQAAVGEGVTIGHRVHPVRHGQGNTAGSERLETAVVGMTGLTTDEQDGTPAHGRPHKRRDCQPHLINAVVVRQWHHRDDGPGGNTVFVTHAAVDKPLQPFDADDDRRLIGHCGIKESTQPWSLQPPPQTTARAVRVQVVFTVWRFAWATASRWPCEQEEMGAEPVGWPRWRRQLRQQTRDKVIVLAQDDYGLFQMAESSILLGAQRKDIPPGLGTPQEVLATYRLTSHG